MNTSSSRALPIAAAIDAAIVVAFIAIGRRNHDRDVAVASLVNTAAPFVISLGIAWVAWRVWQHPTSIRSGVKVWLTTVTLGMLLRKFIFGEGTAASFVVVATVFLSLLLDWRVVRTLRRRRRANVATGHDAPRATAN